jgi:hypothetical protein
VYVQRNTETPSCNHCCSGKVINITLSECVSVVLVIQHAKRVRLIILSSVASLALPYFFTLTHRPREFRKKICLEHKTYILVSSKTFL